MSSRSQADTLIGLGQVVVSGKSVTKSGYLVSSDDVIELLSSERYVSRAGLKLASVTRQLELDFREAIVLDVGSSTGGFTDYALQHGAKQVYAVDVGTDQLHPSLRGDGRIELHEKTDIRDFIPERTPSVVVIDVSFISVRDILPHIFEKIVDTDTRVVVMVKPQFEAGRGLVNKGVIKNDAIRRRILSDFEVWVKRYAIVVSKRDSDVAGAKGNQERFYLLKKLA